MISWQQVTDLRDDIGAEDFGDVVELFLEEVEVILTDLAHGPSLEAQLHALKGSALNLGFFEFAHLCSDGEKMASAGDGDEVSLGGIRLCYQASKDLFMAELDTRLAA